MPKLWNIGEGNGDDRGVPTVKRRDFDGKVKEFVRVPSIYSGCYCASPNAYAPGDITCRCGREQFVEHKPGNVYVSLGQGYAFFTIPRGASWDSPPGITMQAIKGMCPHLVTQEEMEVKQEAAPEPEPKMFDKPKNKPQG